MLGFKLKIRKAKQSSTRETFYLYQIFILNRRNPVSTNPQTAHHSEFLSLLLYPPPSAQSSRSSLHVSSAGIKSGTTTTRICFLTDLW
ncbi:hypothetical protein ACRRTK_005722 [Alexandromys fortis]